MRQKPFLPVLVISTLLVCGCQEESPEPGPDMSRLRLELQKKTEEIYRIHLALDSAAADITAAELKAAGAQCQDAEYLAADAYRNLEKADQDLLQLGRDLQVLFNLDVEFSNEP